MKMLFILLIIIVLLIAITISVVLSGLSGLDQKAQPFSIPAAVEVKKVAWEVVGNTESTKSAIITNKRKIANLIGVIGSENHGWRKSWHTFPIGRHSLIFYGADDKLLLVLWIGENWIGGRNGSEDSEGNRLHSITDERIQDILTILGK